MSRSLRAFRATVVVSGLGYVSQALSLVAIPLFLRIVGADGYGLMVTVMAFMGYVGFADAGLGWGSMVLIAQAHGRNDRAAIAHIMRHSAVLAAGSATLVIVVGAIVVGAARLGWTLPMFAGRPEANRLILIASAQLALNLAFGPVHYLFQGLQQAYWSGFYSGLGRLAGLAAAMGACLVWHSVAAMMLAQLACVALASLAVTMHAVRVLPWAVARGTVTDGGQYRSQFRIGIKSFLLQIGRTIGSTAPTLAISSILGAAIVPFFTVPTTLLSLFFTPLNGWSASLQSAYGEAGEAGDWAWVRAAFRRTIERILLFGGLGIALFVALGDDFVRFWTHGRLAIAPGTAASVAGIALTGALVAAGQFLLTGLNRHRRAALAEIGSGLAALVLVASGVRLWGLAGTGPGVIVAALGTSGWVVGREIYRALGAAAVPAISYVAKSAAAAVVAGAAAAGVGHYLAGGDLRGVLVLLAAAGGAGLAAFVAMALGLHVFPADELRAVLRRLRPNATASTP